MRNVQFETMRNNHIKLTSACKQVVYNQTFCILLPDHQQFNLNKVYSFFMDGRYLGKAKLIQDEICY